MSPTERLRVYGARAPDPASKLSPVRLMMPLPTMRASKRSTMLIRIRQRINATPTPSPLFKAAKGVRLLNKDVVYAYVTLIQEC